MMPGRTDYRATVSSDGSVVYNFPTVFQSMCKMEIWHFPLDDQICTITLGSWSQAGNELDVYPLNPTGKMPTMQILVFIYYACPVQ